MTNRVRSILLAVSAIVAAATPISAARAQPPIMRIGIVVDGPWERNDSVRNLFKDEILELTRSEFDVRFPQVKSLEADWTVDGVQRAIDQQLADPQVDMLLALGVIASNDVGHRTDLPKPVIAPVVIDAQLQGLPLKNGGSGVKNLSYVTYPSTLKEDMRLFRDIVPFTKLVILSSQQYQEAVPELNAKTEKVLQGLGIEAEIVAVGRSIDPALQKIPADAQAAYVAPLIHLPPGDFEKLVEYFIERKLPSFSLFGRSDVERGLLAGSKPDVFPKLSRRVALYVQRILLGEEPGSLPVAFAVGEQLTINMATARAIGLSPSWSVLTEAELINPDRKAVSRVLYLTKTAEEALAANLELAAQDHTVAAGIQSVREARSILLPQINVSALGVVIDADRARASFGQQAERTISGSISATQVVFSEPAWANYSVQRSIQHTRLADRQQLRLDIVQAAATGYLNVLAAKTFERIQRENLKRTRTNLEMARVRDFVGSAGPGEVYRWESQIATNRKTVIEANSQRNLAEIQVNRLLHRPLEESFLTQEADLSEPSLLTAQGRVFKYMADPASFKMFRAFMAEEGARMSPELAGLDAAIAAQERILHSRTNSFLLPTIALQGQVTNIFSRRGAGSDPGIDFELPFTLPQADDNDWSIALNVSYPLFLGGSKLAGRGRAGEELARLRTERKAVAEKIEQRVRSAMHTAGASYAGIQQTREAAEAAQKNLELVSDAYSRGVLTILDLIDAQNAALVAELSAANAVYVFLIDFMEMERAVGRFGFFMTPDERDAFFQRVDDYFEQAGARR